MTITVVYEDENKDPSVEIMPWEKEGWVPRTSTGKPKTPNMIRNQLQKYIDDSGKTKAYVMDVELKVAKSSFHRFMNPKTYKKKNQWAATSNGTFWAAARLLEKHAYEQKLAQKQNKKTATANKKRKSDASDSGPSPISNNKKSKPTSSQDMQAYMQKVDATPLSEEENAKVYDSCPEIIKKIKEFLKRDGVTKASFCRVLQDLNHNSLNRFLASKQQDGAGMVAYERAYVFLEKMRILEGTPKSAARLKNEAQHANGFSLQGPRTGRPPCYIVDANLFLC